MNVYEDLLIPYPPMPKKRPRVTANGTYMPADYVEWKANVAMVMDLKSKILKNFREPVAISIWFAKENMRVRIEPSELTRFGQADIDNLAGGVMDALQLSGVIHNDSQVVELTCLFDTEGGQQ